MLVFLLGDIRKHVSPAAAAAFDHLIADPPYSEHTHSHAVSCAANSPGGRGARARDLEFEHLTPELREYLAQCSARVRRWTLLYSDVEFSQDLARACMAAGAEYIRTVPWVRWSMPQLTADRPPQGWEPLVVLRHPGKSEWYGPGWLTHLKHECLRGSKKHKTEKPLDQSLDLVSWFTLPGEIVFDPCGGRAGLGLACRILGRRYVGGEKNVDHWSIGNERLAAPVGSYGSDAERLARWIEAADARVVKCREVIAHDEGLKARKLARLRELGEPTEKVERRRVAVQAHRCLEATLRDLEFARAA